MCDRHVSQTMADMSWLDANLPDLEEYRINRAYGGEPGAGGPHATAPAPLREQVSDALYAWEDDGRPGLRPVLYGWCRAMAITVHTAQSCGYMLGRLMDSPRLWACTATPVYAEELHDVTRRLRRLMEPAGDMVVLGPCPTCERMLTAHRGADEVKCPVCHTPWPARMVRAVQVKRILTSDVTATPARLAELLSMAGVKVTASTVRSWAHRGRLEQAGEDAMSRPVYRLADAYACAKGGKGPDLWELLDQTNNQTKPKEETK